MDAKAKSSLSLALAAVAVVLCVWVFYQNAPWALYGSYDTGWIVQTGRRILEYGVPTEDTFSWSYLHGAYVAYQWLFAAILGYLAQIGTLWLVGLASCIIVGLLIFFFLPRIWLAQGIPAWLPFLVLSAVQTPNWFCARPQLCSYLLMLLFVSILEHYRLKQGASKLLLVLPPLMVLWANLHSFWFIGLLSILTYFVTDIYRRKTVPKLLAIVLLLSSLAVLVNPYGWKLVAYAFSFVNGTHYMKVWELMPWYATKNVAWTILYVPVCWVILWRYRQSVPVEGFALAAISTAAALTMRRFEPVAVILSWTYLGLALSAINWRAVVPLRDCKLWLSALQLVMALLIPVWAWSRQIPSPLAASMSYTENTFPLLSIIQKHFQPDQKVFNDPQIGSWLIALGGMPVFVDTRFDMYPKVFVEQVNQCLEGKPQWNELFHNWGITQVITRDDMVLDQMLMSSPDWTVVLDDDMITWWLRKSPHADKELDDWFLTDDQLSNAGLPKRILDASIETRAVKYLRLARVYQAEHHPELALAAAQAGLRLMPQSKALLNEQELNGRLLHGSPQH